MVGPWGGGLRSGLLSVSKARTRFLSKPAGPAPPPTSRREEHLRSSIFLRKKKNPTWSTTTRRKQIERSGSTCRGCSGTPFAWLPSSLSYSFVELVVFQSSTTHSSVKEVGKIKMSVGLIAHCQLMQVCQAEYFRQLLKPVT
ncbi:hypothetical protein NL676_012612 [Syzygium grande]|nr:hypothetical protein NL676_012612 [Syzygium grande]